MYDKQERTICELIHDLANNGFNQHEIERIIKVVRCWTFLKGEDEIKSALCRGTAMVDNLVAFRNAMKLGD